MIRNREILIIKFSQFSTIAKLRLCVSYETCHLQENDTGKYVNVIVYAT